MFARVARFFDRKLNEKRMKFLMRIVGVLALQFVAANAAFAVDKTTGTASFKPYSSTMKFG